MEKTQEVAKTSEQQLKEILEVQGNTGNWNTSSYMTGLYNGMELAVALNEDRCPDYRDFPKFICPVPECNSFIEERFSYCPFCGVYVAEDKEELKEAYNEQKAREDQEG